MKEKRYVYLLKNQEGIYKIGVAKDVEQRIKNLQTGYSGEIELVEKFLSDYPFKIESTLHHRFKDNNVHGEWYDMEQEDVDNFKKYCSIMESNFFFMDKLGNPFV